MDIVLSFLTLCLLEIILGIDNLIFISIISNKLPKKNRRKAQFIGLSLSLLIRIGLLFTVSWIMSLTADLFQVFQMGISGRDIILIGGGGFLLYSSGKEIFEKITAKKGEKNKKLKQKLSLRSAITQIIILDVIFSLDSIITAVGLADHFWVMASAVIVAVTVMLLSIKSISDFVNKRPSIKVLALSFLLVIGATLILEGFGLHISKGYIYFAVGFALFVEFLNIRLNTTNRGEPGD